MAVKVGLKDAVDKPLTVDANEFISDLVGREVELKLVSSRQYFFLIFSLLWFSKCLLMFCHVFMFAVR
jgi:hypothetical protein